MCKVKTQNHGFPLTVISTIVPNDTCIKNSSYISFNCSLLCSHYMCWSYCWSHCEILLHGTNNETDTNNGCKGDYFNCCTCMFQQYCTRLNKEKFHNTHRNKNKLRPNWGWISQKITNNEPQQKLLVLIKKKCVINNNKQYQIKIC
mgnify:CR=1 FL=1